MGLISGNQQTTFADPQNGQGPDADVVRNNDNALVAKHNAHDADATVHVQTGLLSARPAASTPYAMYLDENKRLYVDNGSVWAEVPYARLDAAGTNAFTNNVTVGGTLGVTGLLTGGNLDVLDVDAADIVADTVSAGTLAGNGAGVTNVSVLAAKVSAGTLGTGTFTTNGSFVVDNGQLRADRVTQTGAGGAVSFTSANHVRHTMTGNGTLTLSGGAVGGIYTVEVLQDSIGSRTVTWSGAVWPNGVVPTATTTLNRKDVYTFFYDGSNYLGVQFGANFASTG